MENEKKNKLIVIGGGYAGISLLNQLKKSNKIELVLIDKSQTHLLQTHIHKYLSSFYSKKEIIFDYKTYCTQNNIEFICDEVNYINYDNNYIITKQNTLSYYDYLVIATGMLSFFPPKIKNVLKYTKDIKDIDNLDYYKEKFTQMLNSDIINQNIVVVGGGVSGVQIACEYAYTVQKKGFNSNKIQITIIEGMNSLLPGMDSYLVQKAEERCQGLSIKVITNYFVEEILEEKVILSNNYEVDYDMLLFVIGTSGNLIPTENDRIQINIKNQIVVDEFYRIKEYKNTFVIGDIAEAKDIKTKSFQTPTAQSARMQAELTAKNIINDIENKNLIPNNISNKGILIDLGGPNCAIGRLLNFNISGKIALWIKKFIYSLHKNKLNSILSEVLSK